MKLPDLMGSKWGRMTAFFFLYVTEGIPLGFAATAIATQMRRQGVGPAAIGAFVGAVYLPWALKWAYGPIVDVLSSDRLGRRRMWIVLAQLLMVSTLMVAQPVDFTTALYVWLIIIGNTFCAIQDVAIDALAVSTLKEDERGLANGLMFAGAYVGQALGGAGVLYLMQWMSFSATYYFVAGMILLVTVFVALPLQEAKGEMRPLGQGPRLAEVARRIAAFLREAGRSMFGSRAAWLALVFAVLPAGPYALGLALQSNLAVELGLSDAKIASINLYSTIISALGCVAGGFLSDRFGRRKMLALYIAAMAGPTLYMASLLQRHGWILPVSPQATGHAAAAPALVVGFWVATLTYSWFNGLMYGTRAALFMDVTNPAVAATQFTAYMALLNLAIAYSARWQGWAAERWGYPITLLLDALLGVVCLALIPLLKPQKPAPTAAAAA